MTSLAEILQCPHDRILVNGDSETCQICDASMKYVGDPYDHNYSCAENAEWRKWLGPHFNQERVVDWELTSERLGIAPPYSIGKINWYHAFSWILLISFMCAALYLWAGFNRLMELFN